MAHSHGCLPPLPPVMVCRTRLLIFGSPGPVSFLDNAPTYLVFFELAGGNAGELMGPLAGTLAAISMGAVYMGL